MEALQVQRPSVVAGYAIMFVTQIVTGFAFGVGLVLAVFVMRHFFKIGLQ